MAGLLNKLRNQQPMGNCETSPIDPTKRNRQIEHELERDRKTNEGHIKLLLLGAAESGKSTILKQMKIIHDNGFSENEISQKRNIVYGNTVQSMLSIAQGMQALAIFPSHDDATANIAHLKNLVDNKEEAQRFTPQTFKALVQLWGDKGIQAAMARRNEFYIPDCAEYFLDQLERIYDKNYVPSAQDVLHTRVSTMGVIEVSFMMKNKKWRVFDVGGQRSQRKKWIHCFDDVKAVIYVVALSEYDQVLQEDNQTNRMRESLQLFENVCNNKHFLNTNMILFLNKKDIFELKIRTIPLRKAFPEYKKGESYEECVTYITKKFMKRNQNPNKTIYHHETCATDTKQVEFVLDSTLDTILSAKLKGCGLY